MSWIETLHRLVTFSAVLSSFGALLPDHCAAQGTPETIGYEVQVSDTDAGAAEEKRFLRLRVE